MDQDTVRQLSHTEVIVISLIHQGQTCDPFTTISVSSMKEPVL